MPLLVECVTLHNAEIFKNIEETLNEAIVNGTRIWITNPDGTTIALQKGFKLNSVELYFDK